MIPGFKYFFPEKTIQWISETVSELLSSGSYLTMGKYCERFEDEFAKKIGVKHAVSVSSGISALEISLLSKNITQGEIIIPTNTFGASALAAIKSGLKPVYCDISKDMNLDLTDAKKKISNKTKAIMPVHIGGLISEEILEIKDFCKNNNLLMIEDAAHAHGSEFRNQYAGSIGDVAGFSFFPTKVMTTGEGGMMTTSDEKSYENAKEIRNYNKINGSEITSLGYNWRMSEFQAIIGIAQMMGFDKNLEKRRNAAKIYDELLDSNEFFERISIDENNQSSYYKYIIFLPKSEHTKKIQEKLLEKYKISLGGYVYDIPLHRQEFLGKFTRNDDKFPIADDLCSRHVCLPIFPQMTEKEIHYVVDSLNSCITDLGLIK